VSTSLPSHEIYAVDVPEVKNFDAKFKYNFFVPDEQVSEISGIPRAILRVPASEVDTGFIQFITTRTPRFTLFSWTRPSLADVGKKVSDVQMRNNVFDTGDNSTLIADNLKKIMSEDSFSSYDFASVSFHDGEIAEKVYKFVSGSLELHTLDNTYNSNVSTNKAASQFSNLLPQNIKPHFIFAALGNPARSNGSRFSSNGSPITKNYFSRLKHVIVNSQINSKLFHDVVNRNMSDPNSPFSADMNSLHQFSKQLNRTVKQRFSTAINENEFKTVVPFVDLKVQRTAHHAEHQAAQIVGYVIDKFEVSSDGTTIEHPPIVIDNPKSSTCVDIRVKYGKSYAYSMRTIAQFTLPAIDNDTGDIATIKVLISSKPSSKVYVTATESIAPPVPSDINFTWNYETDKLLVHWTFPPNSQRDIKQFQVFRRDSTNVPFELIKAYNFDDSITPMASGERPRSDLLEFVTSPVTFYVDDDFDRFKGSKYTYTVCSIDAHGMTSNYGAQYEVWFDMFKNRLQKKLISHSGAPKPYPNLYLEADAFVDMINFSGQHTKRMKLYFNPQYYQVEDDQGSQTKIIETNQTGGAYKVQFINLDNQKSQILNITIDNRLQEIVPEVSYPVSRLGPARKSRKRT